MNFKVTLIITLFLCYSGVIAQTTLTQIDLSHQYQLTKAYDVKAYGNKTKNGSVIFAAYKLPDSLTALTASFWGADDYKGNLIRIDSLISEEFYLGEKENYHYYEYHLNTPFTIIAIELVTVDNYSHVYEINFDDQKFDVLLYDAESKFPVLDRWLKRNVKYVVSDSDPVTSDLYISYFPYDFEEASPPMSIKEIENKEIQKDSSFIAFDEGELAVENEGFYLFQRDTSSHQGYGWRLEEEAFPGMNRIDQLIAPLRYITTPDEWRRLTEEKSKSAFDSFWLKLGKNEGAARTMISLFYKRVEAANNYFTTYKEGWKTDRGMVYIVYGPPQQVQRTETGETWWYNNDNHEQVFQFLRFRHIFYPFNYVLQRDANYRRSWFTAVDLIRNNRF